MYTQGKREQTVALAMPETPVNDSDLDKTDAAEHTSTPTQNYKKKFHDGVGRYGIDAMQYKPAFNRVIQKTKIVLF